jgi:ATP-dependent DNA ligase
MLGQGGRAGGPEAGIVTALITRRKRGELVAKQPPTGPGWAHELKHDGYRLQIHVRDGRVRLYTINGADWSKRYPLISESAGRIQGSAILDAEVV